MASDKRVLVFAFNKFDKLPSNPSVAVGDHLTGLLSKNDAVQFDVLPTIMKTRKGRSDAFTLLKKSIDSFRPDWIIGLGVASRPRVSVEEIALNRVDSPKSDSAGTVFRHKPISPSSPLALSTSADVIKLSALLKSNGVPSTVSYFADTYVCNWIYFKTLDYLRVKKSKSKCVFIHVPLSPIEVNALDANVPSFPPRLIAEGLSKFWKRD